MSSFRTNSNRVSVGSLPKPGDILGGFRIVRYIDRGGHAAVFEALHEKLDRPVAIKVLLPEVVGNVKGVVERFLREINLVKLVEHSNVVRLYDFGSTDTGQLWMASELVKGIELHGLIKEAGALDPHRVREIMLQMLSGLAAAHEVGIVHRDLKPSNIMLTRKGADHDVVKILDFGIAKTLENEDELADDVTGDVKEALGTPRYMAPEVLKHAAIGPYTDVYSAGIILTEMLTGKPAFDADTLMQIMAAQMVKRILLPDWIETSPFGPVIHRATAKDPESRYPTALEFHAALKQIGPAALELLEHQRGLDVSSLDDPTTSPGVSVQAFRTQPARLTTGPVPTSNLPDGPLVPRRSFFALHRWAIGATIAVLAVVVGLVVASQSDETPAESDTVKEEETVSVPKKPVDAQTTQRVAADREPVSITFKSIPHGAAVFDEGLVKLCEPTPCTAAMKYSNKSASVTYELLEYKPVRATVVPNKDRTTEVILVPIAIDSEMSIEVMEVPVAGVPKKKKEKEQVKVDPFAIETFD
ncbi:MAG: hypothetical protein AUK47_16980 [Deltaproteobacteria bacterium CG2_30_63_29]|nr:MAG: hypothetical protein AUK47_16980 [Deltaproteobacteria bacterium CG2_30_63_29]